MKKINYYILSLIALVGCVFTSCKDDETTLSRAVLASVDLLEYDAIPSGPQIITVISDADWISEAPEWVTISPATGHAGQTEVTISVQDNMREGAKDNPRKTTIKFKGRNLWSESTVIIRQDGDKFRDPIDYTIEAMESAEDETVVRLPNMIVTALTGNGFIATDGTNYVYVKEPVIAVEAGQKVSIVGEKYTDDMKMAYVLGEKISDEGSAVIPEKTPVDITDTFDKTDGKKYQFITVSGDYDGSSLTVGKMNCKGYFVDAPASSNISQLGGHKVKVTGYFAGQASPVVNIIPIIVEDLGVNEIIYFADDFEWLEPWSNVAGVHDWIKESDTVKAESKNLTNVVDGVTAEDAIYERGYSFVKATHKAYEDRPFNTRIYIQKNYLKFGLTGIQAGLVLPSIKDIPEGENLELCFDWAPMRQGDPGAENRKYDPSQLLVVVENGGSEKHIEVPPHTLVAGAPMEWMKAVVDLSGLAVNENTKITIRQIDSQWPYKADDDKSAVCRYFLDNIKLRQKK